MAMKRGAVPRVAQRIDDDEEEQPRRRKKVRVGIDPRLIQKALREAHVETFGTALPRPERKRRKAVVSETTHEPPGEGAASNGDTLGVAALSEPTPFRWSNVEPVSEEELASMRRRLDELHRLIRMIAAVLGEWRKGPTVAVNGAGHASEA